MGKKRRVRRRESGVESVYATLTGIVKPAVYLGLVLFFVALVGGAVLPIGSDFWAGVVAWFVLLVGAVTAFLVGLFRYRRSRFRCPETPSQFANRALFSVLGVIGAGSFGIALVVGAARATDQNSRSGGLVLGGISLLLALLSLRGLARLFQEP